MDDLVDFFIPPYEKFYLILDLKPGLPQENCQVYLLFTLRGKTTVLGK